MQPTERGPQLSTHVPISHVSIYDKLKPIFKIRSVTYGERTSPAFSQDLSMTCIMRSTLLLLKQEL